MTTCPARPTQASFARALLDATLPTPAGLCAWNGSDPGTRFAVYRNNVVVSLTQALADSFPVVRQLVGPEFFDAMARLYLCETPPTSPILAHHGDDFADWVQHFEPATALPYLADMARLERARVRAYHAADATRVPQSRWQNLLAEPLQLIRCRVVLHPSLTLVRSPFAVASLWHAHQADDEAAIDTAVAGVALEQPEHVLIWREEDDVYVQPVAPALVDWTDALSGGLPLGAASASHPEVDLTTALAFLLQHALVVELHPSGEPS